MGLKGMDTLLVAEKSKKIIKIESPIAYWQVLVRGSVIVMKVQFHQIRFQG